MRAWQELGVKLLAKGSVEGDDHGLSAEGAELSGCFGSGGDDVVVGFGWKEEDDFLWSKRGELCGECGVQTVTFLGA